MRNRVISLYDYTGEALRPWAEAGYECFAYDIRHEGQRTEDGITYIHVDLHDPQTLLQIVAKHTNKAYFMSAFPPCTDLASSGAMWWKKKAEANPHFQTEATLHVKRCGLVGEALDCPFYIENPVGALTRLWRKFDYIFNPCDFGGYLPKGDVHPMYPENIPPRDAYRKKTCLWTGGGFNMPRPNAVAHETVTYERKDPKKGGAFSPVHGKTGGKSLLTKSIRSATPRGFAKAVFLANAYHTWINTTESVGGVREYRINRK